MGYRGDVRSRVHTEKTTEGASLRDRKLQKQEINNFQKKSFLLLWQLHPYILTRRTCALKVPLARHCR